MIKITKKPLLTILVIQRLNMITGDEYYKTWGDEFGYDGNYGENDFYEDYGQKYDTRQFFKHDFNKEVTKFMGGIK